MRTKVSVVLDKFYVTIEERIPRVKNFIQPCFSFRNIRESWDCRKRRRAFLYLRTINSIRFTGWEITAGSLPPRMASGWTRTESPWFPRTQVANHSATRLESKLLNSFFKNLFGLPKIVPEFQRVGK